MARSSGNRAQQAMKAWKTPVQLQPRPEDYAYSLDEALSAVVGLSAHVPAQAFTAETLGTERSGHGVAIRNDGLILTMGYLVAEASAIWISLSNGRVEPGHVIAYDQESGFGLVQALARVDLPTLSLGQSSEATLGQTVIVAGSGGKKHCVAAHVVARQDFTGYWEYVVENAIFTSPGHPNWGGAALIGPQGDLLGIGSLQLEQQAEKSAYNQVNMIVPTDLLKPVLDDLVSIGRRRTPPRPWLGLYAADVEGHVVVLGVSTKGPAKEADVQTGDVILEIAGTPVSEAARFFRKLWSLGAAGVETPLRLQRDGRNLELNVISADRSAYLARPKLH